ncbi:hypothetical protein B0H66DRAFT_556046 [Apodospora peruviana]|uniref:Uncharacterized protein n=1 Tax=Apodospora peruviana TaxID=516989 RepID=A0AAE0I419_9PEZI|nr:hypothetical protein B0H66DRAFT_556046 [Apodospora peruviana]
MLPPVLALAGGRKACIMCSLSFLPIAKVTTGLWTHDGGLGHLGCQLYILFVNRGSSDGRGEYTTKRINQAGLVLLLRWRCVTFSGPGEDCVGSRDARKQTRTNHVLGLCLEGRRSGCLHKRAASQCLNCFRSDSPTAFCQTAENING